MSSSPSGPSAAPAAAHAAAPVTAPATAPATPLALPTGAIACLSFAGFGSAISLRVNDAMLPRLAADFSLSLAQAAQVVSVFSIAYGLAQLLFGPLGDRFGKYRVIAFASAACAATALMCSLAPSFPLLLLARVMAGITAAALIPLSMAWIGDVVPYEQRQPVLARFLLGQITGLGFGVWMGGVAADHFSWRTPYLGLAGLFSGVALALFALDRRLPAAARRVHAPQGSAWRRMVSEFGQVWAQPWARVILVTVFLEGACLYGPFAFIASHLHARFGLSLASAGSLVLLYGAGGVVFALCSARLLAWLGELGLARWGGGLLALALLVIGFAPAWGWSLVGCPLAGLGFYMIHNTLQVNATQMAPERRGAAVSAFAACFFLGQSAGVAGVGLLVLHFGTAPALAAGAVGLLWISQGFARRLARKARAAA